MQATREYTAWVVPEALLFTRTRSLVAALVSTVSVNCSAWVKMLVSESCPTSKPFSSTKLAVPETDSTRPHSELEAATVFAQNTMSPREGIEVPDVTTTVVPPAATSAEAATARQAADPANTEATDRHLFPVAASLTSTRYSVPLVPKATVLARPWSMKTRACLMPVRARTLEAT